MRSALETAQKKYPDAFYHVPVAKLPALMSEPGVLILYSDRLLFEHFGGVAQMIPYAEIKRQSFRSPTADDGGYKQTRILRLDMASDYLEFAVAPDLERFIQSVFDFAGIKKSETQVASNPPAFPRADPR